MTYNTYEQSKQGGRPVFLYLFQQGSQAWRFTTRGVQETFGGEPYLPTTASHTEVKQSSEMSKDGIKLTFKRTDAFASQFLGYAPDVVTTLTVFRFHSSDPSAEAMVYWKGRVAGSRAGGATIEVECESIFTSMRRPGLRARYQRSCRHALYGRGCNLDPEAFAVAAVADSLSASQVVLTSSEAAAKPDGFFFGGMVRASDESLRLIVNHVGSTLTLSRPLIGLKADLDAVGYGESYGGPYGEVAIKLYPGCDHTPTGCLGFDNLDNYGGFPYIPKKNPMGGSSIV